MTTAVSPTHTPAPYYVDLNIDTTGRPTSFVSPAMYSATERALALPDDETASIEGNGAFYATLVNRLRTAGKRVEASEIFPELAQ